MLQKDGGTIIGLRIKRRWKQLKEDIKKIKKIAKRLLLIPVFIILVPINIITFYITPKKYRYFDDGIIEYIKLNIRAVKYDWKNI